MITSLRVGATIGLAIFLGGTAAEAQTFTDDRTDGRTMPAVTRTITRSPAAAPYRRTTTTARRGTAYATSRGGLSSYQPAPGEYDPLRPYSAQVRQRASAISPTRPEAATPPPPRVMPPAITHNYYPGLRNYGHNPNANVPMRPHCTPSRGGVLGGSLGSYGR